MNVSSCRVLVGDALAQLRTLPGASVQCCITSPPYYGLRDYGAEGQIGLEPTPAEYVGRLVAVFREVRRVLVDTGTLWLNLGDSYSGSGKGGEDPTIGERNLGGLSYPKMVRGGAKPKDLLGIPWLVAFGLRADGWWLRSDIIWAKSNPMPESVTDRPTRSHEYVFLLSKSERYYYDAAAIRETARATTSHDATGPGYEAPGQAPQTGTRRPDKQRGHGRRHAGFDDRWDAMPKAVQQSFGRNKRDVWTVATEPYPEAHWAVMPEALVEPMVMAGCPAGGVVLDPFAGSGTTLAVAMRLGRHAIGVELNPAYVALIQRRAAQPGFVWEEGKL